MHAAGKIPEPGECYTYVTLPVFAEGKYEVDNLNPVPAGEHFSVTGHILHEIHELPDDAKVKLAPCSDPLLECGEALRHFRVRRGVDHLFERLRWPGVRRLYLPVVAVIQKSPELTSRRISAQEPCGR